MDTSAEDILKGLLDASGIPYSGIERNDLAGQIVYSINADGRELIGVHGDTVHAIDHLVKKIVEKRSGSQEEGKEHGSPHFLVDVNGYRSKQIKDLQNKALMMAERARSFQYDVELSPMSAYERLLVHSTLAGQPNVKTESQGEGRSRRVVIRYVSGN